ncbi:hypothetical protein K435DRAFT_894193 [Dendrothele bispora CBS 962.96]|uniref:Uncharacterized protein n=1 Tax=Dendrothele bispora (strain CBS 962.96) TaxID=1314807 RepID=A0A4V4HAW9_DENBC|nr:hypothetical protein K435DRAFT_894193 [Dendrothele bispora CBS 962.96]
MATRYNEEKTDIHTRRVKGCETIWLPGAGTLEYTLQDGPCNVTKRSATGRIIRALSSRSARNGRIIPALGSHRNDKVCRCITRFWIFLTPLLLDPNFRVGKKMGWLKQIRKKIKDGVQQLLIVSDSSDSKDELESDSIQFHISISNKVKISEGVIPSPSTESNSSVLGKGNHAGEQSSSQESTVQVPVLDNKGKTIAFRELSPVYENTSEEQLKSSAQSYKQVPVYKKGKIISYHQVSSSPKEPVRLGLSQVPIQDGNDTQQTSRNKKVPVIDNNGNIISYCQMSEQPVQPASRSFQGSTTNFQPVSKTKQVPVMDINGNIASFQEVSDLPKTKQVPVVDMNDVVMEQKLSSESGQEEREMEGELQSERLDLERKMDMERTRKHYAQISPSKSQCSDSNTTKKVLNEYPSFSWRPTTCWLDSSLEAYYHTLLHYNHWNEFAAFAEPAEKEEHKSGIHYLFACLDARCQWPISLFPGSASQVATTDLTNIRNLFHAKLYSLKIVQGSSQQTTFRWFEALVSPSPSDPFTKIPECTNFFQLHTQNIWICSGGNDDNAHTRIDRPWKQTVIQSMTPANHEIYGGSFKAWFQNNVNIKTRSLGEFVEKNCGRYRSENYFCHGPSIQISYISEIPVILSVESIQDVDADKGMGNTDALWDFPHYVFPLTQRLGNECGLVYELTARIFTSGDGGHFICRSVIPVNGRATVFDYDGMKYHGYSQRISGRLDELIAGNKPPCPAGYYTHAVIYHLKGGNYAQMVFCDHQLSEAQKHLGLVPDDSSVIPKLVKPDFVELSDKAISQWKDRPGREYQQMESENAETLISYVTNPSFLLTDINTIDAPVIEAERINDLETLGSNGISSQKSVTTDYEQFKMEQNKIDSADPNLDNTALLQSSSTQHPEAQTLQFIFCAAVELNLMGIEKVYTRL